MLMKSLIAARTRPLAMAILAAACWTMTAPAPAQEPEPGDKTIGDHIKEYWHKVIAKTESTAKATGEEYHKLKEKAARASGPAREKMAAEMEDLGKKWAAAREKVAASVEIRMNMLHDEMKEMEEKAGKASGKAKEKMVAEGHKLHEEWTAARAKMEATLSSNMHSSREQLEHLKEHAATATEEARAKLGPRMDRLKHEFHKDREKLAAYLEADLKQTKEDMEKIGAATTRATIAAKEKLSEKYHDIEARIKELRQEKESD